MLEIIIFVVNVEDVVVPAVGTMSKRDRYIVDCSPIGVLNNAARNILRPQEV